MGCGGSPPPPVLSSTKNTQTHPSIGARGAGKLLCATRRSARVLHGRVEEGGCGAVDVAKIDALGGEEVGADCEWGITDRNLTGDRLGEILQSKKRHHAVLLNTVTGNADPADQRIAA